MFDEHVYSGGNSVKIISLFVCPQILTEHEDFYSRHTASFIQHAASYFQYSASFILYAVSFLQHGNSIIKQFSSQDTKARDILSKRIFEDIKEMQRNTESLKSAGICPEEIGAKVLMSAALAAPPNQGLSLVATADGGATALDVNILISEDRNFIENVELLKKSLEEIKSTFKKLEKESAEARVEITPTDMKEVWISHIYVFKLKEMNEGLIEFEKLLQVMDKLVTLTGRTIRVHPTHEVVKELKKSILLSADQCQVVVSECNKVKIQLLVVRKTISTTTQSFIQLYFINPVGV